MQGMGSCTRCGLPQSREMSGKCPGISQSNWNSGDPVLRRASFQAEVIIGVAWWRRWNWKRTAVRCWALDKTRDSKLTESAVQKMNGNDSSVLLSRPSHDGMTVEEDEEEEELCMSAVYIWSNYCTAGSSDDLVWPWIISEREIIRRYIFIADKNSGEYKGGRRQHATGV